jgi:hypothetical protein
MTDGITGFQLDPAGSRGRGNFTALRYSVTGRPDRALSRARRPRAALAPRENGRVAAGLRTIHPQIWFRERVPCALYSSCARLCSLGGRHTENVIPPLLCGQYRVGTGLGADAHFPAHSGHRRLLPEPVLPCTHSPQMAGELMANQARAVMIAERGAIKR